MVIIIRIISYKKIEENIIRISKTNELWIVLKNDAYNFGIEKILEIGIKNNILNYAINDINEGIKLRLLNNDISILLFGYNIDNICNIKKYNIIPTTSTIDEILEYKKNKIKYAIKIDIGMNRFGFKQLNKNLLLDSDLCLIYIHFPKIVDNIDDILEYYNKLSSIYNKKIIYGGSLLYSYTDKPLRIGKIIYDGCDSLYANVLMVKKIFKGEEVGYDGEYRALADELIAVLDIGYYNGIKPNFNGYVYHNKLYRVIGRVCMNNMFIRADEDIKIGDVVEIFGQNISKKEFLIYNNMSEYESFLLIK